MNKSTLSLTSTTTAAVQSYGLADCIEAYRQNSLDGEGASTVAQNLGYRDHFTLIGNTLIEAGREIDSQVSAKIESQLSVLIDEWAGFLTSSNLPAVSACEMSDTGMLEWQKQYKRDFERRWDAVVSLTAYDFYGETTTK